MNKPALVYTIYIATTAEKLWRALTEPEFTKQYFGGDSVESDWKVGSTFILRMQDGRIDVRGEVLECDPPRRLTVSWVQWTDLRDLPPARISFLIEPLGEVCRLTLTETPGGPVDEEILEGARQGWAMILSGLKSLLETGRALKIPWPPETD